MLIRWVDTGDMDCVTRSQTERMWAFDDPGVRDTDLVVTIDANAFVYNASSLNPVYNNPEKLIWVFQYQDTAAIPTDMERPSTRTSSWHTPTFGGPLSIQVMYASCTFPNHFSHSFYHMNFRAKSKHENRTGVDQCLCD